MLVIVTDEISPIAFSMDSSNSTIRLIIVQSELRSKKKKNKSSNIAVNELDHSLVCYLGYQYQDLAIMYFLSEMNVIRFYFYLKKS